MRKRDSLRPTLFVLLSVAVAWVWLHRGALSYLLHDPASLRAAWLGCLGALLRSGAAALLLSLGIGLGHCLSRRFRPPGVSPGEQVILEAALGLGIVSHCLFGLGCLGLWTSSALWGSLLLGAPLAALGMRRLRPLISFPRPPDWPRAFLAFPILLAILYGWISANVPPTDWDSLAVHLAVPKLYAQRGALEPLRWLLHGFDAMAIEMFYVPALLWRDPPMTAMVSVTFEGLMAAALVVCGKQVASGRAAWTALALFLSQPAVIYVSGTPGTDFGVGLFGMLGFWTAWRALQTRKAEWLLWSGALSGLAAASKLTGLLLAASLGLLLAAYALRRERRLLPWIGAWLAAAAVLAAPWYLRNALYTGNPVWPYFSSLFGGDERSVHLFLRAKSAALEAGRTGWKPLLLLPYRLVFQPELFGHESHILVLPFLALGLVSWPTARRKPFARWTLAYLGLFTLIWFHVLQNWRYFIPLMPWMSLLACDWARTLWSENSRRKAAAAVLAVGFTAIPSFSANNALFPLLRLKPSDPAALPEEAYLSRSVNSHSAVAFINRTFPRDAKILLYREVRAFYLDRDYLVGDPQNETLIGYERLRSPEELYLRLRRLGITHVLVNPARAPFDTTVPEFIRAEALMKAMLGRHACAPLNIGGVLIHALKRP